MKLGKYNFQIQFSTELLSSSETPHFFIWYAAHRFRHFSINDFFLQNLARTERQYNSLEGGF